MKTLLRSVFVLMSVLVLTGVASFAYFSSNVSATGNLIQTGTLRLALDSTAPGGGNAGYVVAYDNNGVVTQLANFPTITDMAPGITRSVYVAVRNIGSLPFDYRANVSGNWANATIDTGTNATYLTATAQRLGTLDCTVDAECNDIATWLNGFGYSQEGPTTTVIGLGDAHATSFFGHPNTVSDGSYTLDNGPSLLGEYSVFKVDFTLSTAAGNDFQGQTFTWSLNAQAKQTTAPSF